MALTGTSFEGIDLFPFQKKLLEELLEPYELVPNALTTVAESVPTEPLTVQHLEESLSLLNDPVSDPVSATEDLFSDEGYTSQEIIDTGMIYAPFIPLYTSPSVNVSDLKKIRFRNLEPTFKIPKYNDIYSDISKRFEILDL